MHTGPNMEYVNTICLVVSILYLFAAIAYGQLLLSGKKQASLPTWILGTGLVTNAAEILLRGAESGAAGGAPFATTSGFMTIFAFLLGLIYLFLERRYSRRYRIASLGAFHVPVVFAVHSAAFYLKQPLGNIPDLNKGTVFVLHVVPAICAYAALAAAFVSGIAFLLLERQLRRKRFGLLFRGLPNLELVERMNAAAVRIGLPLLGFGLFMGLVRGYMEFGPAFKWDPKVWVSFLIVIIYGLQLILRRFAGWEGRKAVLISIVGFFLIVLNVSVLNIYFSELHGFR